MGKLKWSSALDTGREEKKIELNHACNQAITGRFIAEVKGVPYYFSCDSEAQSNFEKGDRAFEKGRVPHIGWTAYTMEGEVVRLILTEETFEPIYMNHLIHITSNIEKLRDFLEPLVDEASLDDLEDIQW